MENDNNTVDYDSILTITASKAVAGNGLSGQAVCNADIPKENVKASDRLELYGGNARYVSQISDIPSDMIKISEQLSDDGKTPMFFATDKEFLGIIAVADTIKEDSPEAIKQLKDMGLYVVMITGDNEKSANAIGKIAGVDEVVAGVLPDGKEKEIRRLKKYGRVIMVGDGINDAPALTTADIGIAIGAGTDVAIDAADVVLMKSRLSDVAAAIRLSHRTIRNIHENLFWAFIYNIIGVPIAAGILYPINGFLLNPMIAGAAMAFSSVSVVSNSLLLKRKRIHEGEENKEVEPPTETIMKKEFKVEGMMCNHCRMHVEKALNSMEGIHATVTLNPPVATVEFSDGEKTLEELQKVVTKEAGDYTLKA